MTGMWLAMRRPRLSVRLVILTTTGSLTGGVLGFLAGLLSAPPTPGASASRSFPRGALHTR